MEKKALGLIETVGMAAALEAADAAVKSANVALIGYELSKGGGMVTIKIEGDVGAVTAAVQAGSTAAGQINRVCSSKVIPRPHDEIRPMIASLETIGSSREKSKKNNESKIIKEANQSKVVKKQIEVSETEPLSLQEEAPTAETEKKHDPDLQPVQ